MASLGDLRMPCRIAAWRTVFRSSPFIHGVTGCCGLDDAPRHAAARSVKAAQGFAAAEDPLAQLLLAGNRVAALRVLVSAGRVHENPDQVAQWTPGVQAAYNALA